MGLVRSALASRPVNALTSPHTIDHYLDQLHPMMTAELVRARVVDVIRETDVATTVVLRPNGAWRGFRPGQHVEFGVEVDGTRKVRVFSVSSAARGRRGTISVSVKAHEDGYVSRFLNRELSRRTIVHLSQATGDFVLPDVVPDEIALVSGGSGITPVMSMARTLRDRARHQGGHQRRVTFLHYAKSRADEMFSDELDKLAAQLPNAQVVRVYTREPEPGAALAGRFHVDHLKHLGVDPATVPTWVCGPAGLIAGVRDTYAELGADEQLHAEYFKVPTVDLSAADATGTVSFEASGTSAANNGATILQQAEEAGLVPEFGCRMGVCNTCAVKKLSGAVRHVVSGEVNANTDETIKVCVNVPVGDVNVAL